MKNLNLNGKQMHNWAKELFDFHRSLAGKNNHHIAEAAMKALGRALDMATTRDPRIAGLVPSTKETLTD